MREPEDGDLIRCAQAGNREAAGALCRRYASPLYNFVFWRADGRREEAEEIVQETCLDALRSLRTFRGEAAFFTWLCAIARRRLAGRSRRNAASRALFRADPDIERLVGYLEGREPLPHEALEREEVRGVISGCLAALPPRWQALLKGKYVDGRSAEDLARENGEGATAVHSALQRAREALASSLRLAFTEAEGGLHA
ncbi:MAG: sigma-70 family RNA polymerase sigma factor [Planctomycetes bacterium]|nr:sigma-70 family RNA polymerase sigma factor [Planctomycetota bacterium]